MVITDISNRQSPGSGNTRLFIAIGLAVPLCGAAVIVIARRRRRPGDSQQLAPKSEHLWRDRT
ncbi:MAG TPA: hypothetical protein DD735_04865 [Clostridiales bacterium]|nr:hypothetical protein [Clostridiales bacterium]